MANNVNNKIVSVDPERFKLDTANLENNVLIGYRCQTCNVYVFGPSTYCQSCSSRSMEEVEFAGTAILYSYTVIHVPPAGWPGRVPYVLGEAELSEGPHVLAELIDSEVNEIETGIKLSLTYELVQNNNNDIAVYKWRFN
jgi:uncharacterized OB-fold protein